MPMDLSQIIQAAAEAALQGKSSNDQQSTDKAKGERKGMTTPRALLIGAGVFTAGRLLVGSRGRDMLEDLQERLAIYESEHFGSGDSEDEEFDDEPEGEYDEDDEPEDVEDDEEFDEPEGEFDEGDEPEGEYDEDDEPEDVEDDEEFDEPEDENDEDEEPEGDEDEDQEEPDDEERPRRRRTSSAGSSRNGRH